MRERWRNIIGFYLDQHCFQDPYTNEWKAKPTANPGPSEAKPQFGVTRDLRNLPKEIQEQSFVAGDFRNEKKPIVQGLANSPDSQPLKRKRELLDEGPETIRKRQEVVDSRLEKAANEKSESAEIHSVLNNFTKLSSLDPQKGKTLLAKFATEMCDRAREEAKRNIR